MLLGHVKKFVMDKNALFPLIALSHFIICIIVAHVHNLTVQRVVFFNTGGLLFGVPWSIFFLIFQSPIFLLLIIILSLRRRLTAGNFITWVMVINSVITFLALCLYSQIGIGFITLAANMGFLTLLFCLLYLFINRNGMSGRKLIIFYCCYSMFVAMMLMVPYTMKAWGISWLHFYD